MHIGSMTNTMTLYKYLFYINFLHTNHHLMLNQWMRNNKNKALKFSSIWLSREPSNWGYRRHFCQSTNHHNDKEHLHPISLNQLWQRQVPKIHLFSSVGSTTAGTPHYYQIVIVTNTYIFELRWHRYYVFIPIVKNAIWIS